MYSPEDIPLEWKKEAACRGSDPKLFFSREEEEIQMAKSVCAACRVARICLEVAVTTREDHGVWGGTSEKERRVIIKARLKEQDSA